MKKYYISVSRLLEARKPHYRALSKSSIWRFSALQLQVCLIPRACQTAVMPFMKEEGALVFDTAIGADLTRQIKPMISQNDWQCS
jgi:hypothetical protein